MNGAGLLTAESHGSPGCHPVHMAPVKDSGICGSHSALGFLHMKQHGFLACSNCHRAIPVSPDLEVRLQVRFDCAKSLVS